MESMAKITSFNKTGLRHVICEQNLQILFFLLL